MENIVFSLEESNKGNNILLGEEDLNTLFASEADIFPDSTSAADIFPDSTDAVVLEHYYKKNYNVKGLQQILQYYGIPKKNMTKDEMIQRILFFEMEDDNRAITIKRMRFWQNIRDLKADAYFAKFINFNV
jgi:hypothetical protein